jgi:CoA-disulfide reductase
MVMKKKVLIVGGVAGGASAAARLRRLDENIEIIMFERGEYISFANCGLPYYIGEAIKDRDKLLVQTPESMKSRFNMDVRINSEVMSINTESKTVKVSSKAKGVYEENYDYLVLSPGAKPLKPQIKGIDSERIFTLRNVPDTDRIKEAVDSKNIKRAVVIGGGYIGIEMAENLKERDIEVALVEAAPHVLAPFDSDISAVIEKELEDNGVKLILEDGVKSFKDNEEDITITLSSGENLTAELVVLAIGVVPDTEFLKDSGLKLGSRGHILVNDNMQTNAEGVYAVGDAVEVIDYINGNNAAIPLAGPANRQGRIAADNICGINTTYKGTLGTSIIKVFGMTAASTGNNERTLQKMNIPYRVVYVHPQSHASYYPGASPLTIKLIFNDEERILGAQVLGYDAVDKTLDVIAAVIKLKGTVTDLTELELAYAPPYSSAKSPVNMAGFAAENILKGRVDVFVPEDIEDFNPEKSVLLDVRTSMEFEGGHLEGAVNIPVDDLRPRLQELDKNKEYWVYCQVGLRGYIASRIMSQHGFTVKNMTGGYKSLSGQRYSSLEAVTKFDGDNMDGKGGTMNIIDERGNLQPDKTIDASGLCCPGPLMTVKKAVDEMLQGQILEVIASDPGFYEDIKAWCSKTNNKLINLSREGAKIIALIEKNTERSKNNDDYNYNVSGTAAKDNKTIVVFSGDLDKAIASFIIANGAASMGKKVTMFFTFWGINILRKNEKVKTVKGFIEKMFAFMMPRGSMRLKLSNMNMMGIGPKMIRKIMKDKNVNSLEELVQSAVDNGVEIVACQMSMDLLGLKKEELIDGIKIGGVGYYLGEAEESNVNLFI